MFTADIFVTSPVSQRLWQEYRDDGQLLQRDAAKVRTVFMLGQILAQAVRTNANVCDYTNSIQG